MKHLQKAESEISNTLPIWCEELTHWKKALMLAKIEGKRRRGHHWLNGHESKQTPGDTEGQGSLVCYSAWCCKESDTTEQLNNKCLYVCNRLEKMLLSLQPESQNKTYMCQPSVRLETHKHEKKYSMPLSLEMICYETLLLAPSCSLSFFPFSLLGAFSGRDYLLPLL